MAHFVETAESPAVGDAPARPDAIGAVGAAMMAAIVIAVVWSPVALVRIGKFAPAMAVCTVVHLMTFYVLARAGGVAVETVSIYYGGGLLRCRRGGTWFAFNWLPLGGFVKMKGMEGPSAAAAAASDGWLRLTRIARAGF